MKQSCWNWNSRFKQFCWKWLSHESASNKDQWSAHLNVINIDGHWPVEKKYTNIQPWLLKSNNTSSHRSLGTKTNHDAGEYSSYHWLVHDVQCNNCCRNFHSRSSLWIGYRTNGIPNSHLYWGNLVSFELRNEPLDLSTVSWKRYRNLNLTWDPFYSLQHTVMSGYSIGLHKHHIHTWISVCVGFKYADAMEKCRFGLSLCANSHNYCALFCKLIKIKFSATYNN